MNILIRTDERPVFVPFIIQFIKATFHYAIQVAATWSATRPNRRPAASWNLAYHALSSSLAAS